ncbi:MAG: hypothetical protein AAGD43_07510 [Pseudomonadota bacterium]
MTSSNHSKETVLGIHFNKIGFGYAVFEGISLPVDWHIKRAEDRHDGSFGKQIFELLDRYDPTVIVIRKCLRKEPWPCSDRTKRRTKKLEAIARRRKLPVFTYSRLDIRKCFSRYGATNKDEIARAIGELVPELQHRVPPMRRLWENESYLMGLFDAIALILTFYWSERLNQQHLS